jgi:uncharacterized damage-inducible protein DinB
MKGGWHVLETLSQYESIRERLLLEIQGFSAQQLNWRSDDSSWSIAQVVEHICKVEDSTMRLLPAGLAQSPKFQQRDLPLQTLIPDRSTKVQAPSGLEPGDGMWTYGRLLSLLTESRQRTIALLKGITDTSLLPVTSPPYPHPVFGQLSTKQWIEFIPLHELRHIQQIEELKEDIIANTDGSV